MSASPPPIPAPRFASSSDPNSTDQGAPGHGGHTVFDIPLVFVDLETTGGTAGEDRITEIGIVELSGQGVSRWTTLVNPERPIPPFIQQLTGITDEMVSDAPAFDAIAASLFARLHGKLFVAHNASFDRAFLRSEFKRAGLHFNPDVLCTVRLSRGLFPHEKRHGLDALIERHALEPMARHRALADADLVWQFWQSLHTRWPADLLREQIERTVRRYRIAGEITEDVLDSMPEGCGVYAFFDAGGQALYVGRTVRLRQRVRAHLTGERRSAREARIAQQVAQMKWCETGGELGALLAEAQWIDTLRPLHNRMPRAKRGDPVDAPWPYEGPVVFEERGERAGGTMFHLVDRWRYLCGTPTIAAALERSAAAVVPAFELSTYRILQTHLARGLRLVPLASLAEPAAAPRATAAG